MPGMIEKGIDGSRGAMVKWDDYTCQLLTTHNGYHWSGASIQDLEVAEAALSALSEYVQRRKQLLHEESSKVNRRRKKTMTPDAHFASVEKLVHYLCGSPACRKWWSIGDGPVEGESLHCPKCGHRAEVQTHTQPDSF